MYRRGMRVITFAVVAAVGAAACEDPRVTVVLDFDSADGAVLATELERVQVSVYELDQPCDDLALGRLSQAELDVSLRARTTLHSANGRFGSAELSGIPRLGPKLFALVGTNGNVVQAGGCSEHGDITEDLELPIEVEPALYTRVLPSTLLVPSLILPAPGETLQLVSRQRLLDGTAAPLESIEVSLRSGTTGTIAEQEPTAYGTLEVASVADGLFTLGDLTAPRGVVGPMEIVVRGRWSDQVNAISAAVAPPSLAAVDLTNLGGVNQIDPSWVILDGTERLVAVALHEGASGVRRTVLARESVSGDGFDEPTSTTTPALRTLAVFQRAANEAAQIVSRNGTGWVIVGTATGTPVLDQVTAGGATPADEIIGLPPCAERDGIRMSDGLIVRSGDVVAAFDGLAPAPSTTGVAADLVAHVVELAGAGVSLSLLGAACLPVARTDGGEQIFEPVLAVRRSVEGVETVHLVVAGAAPLQTAFLGAVTAIPVGAGAAILAASRAANGMRVVSYRVKYDRGAGTPVRIIPDGEIDHPLPGVPRALSALDANGDGEFDTVSLCEFDGVIGLGMTLGSDVAGREISASSVRAVIGAEQRLVRVAFRGNGDRDEVALVGSNGLGIFAMGRAP